MQVGHEECEPMHMFGPATRNHFLFHYILSGKGVLYSDDDRKETTEYHLESGQGFMVWPGQSNTYLADENDPWSYMWIEFDGLKAKEFVIQSGLDPNRPVYNARDMEEHEKMKHELQYIISHSNDPPMELIGHLYLFLSALIDSSALSRKTTGGGLQFFYVNEAVKYVELHFQDEITIEDIAAHCNLNRSYLGKIFRTVMKTNLQDFLIRYRMNRACDLMKISQAPIGEICNMVGYPNLFNFSRVFKRTIGKSPSEWRKENRLR